MTGVQTCALPIFDRQHVVHALDAHIQQFDAEALLESIAGESMYLPHDFPPADLDLGLLDPLLEPGCLRRVLQFTVGRTHDLVKLVSTDYVAHNPVNYVVQLLLSLSDATFKRDVELLRINYAPPRPRVDEYVLLVFGEDVVWRAVPGQDTLFDACDVLN